LTELGVDYVNLQVPQLETLATEAKERLGAVVSRAANSE
jgi:hypothetical protein